LNTYVKVTVLDKDDDELSSYFETLDASKNLKVAIFTDTVTHMPDSLLIKITQACRAKSI